MASKFWKYPLHPPVLPHLVTGNDAFRPDESIRTFSCELEPWIEEMIRTKHYPKEPVVLVDRIVGFPVSRTKKGHEVAYRFFLSDGENVIQGLLNPSYHKPKLAKTVTEGSYIGLKKYELKVGKKLAGGGDILYLGIHKLEEVAWQPRYIKATPTCENEPWAALTRENIALIRPLERGEDKTRACPVIVQDEKRGDELVGPVQMYDGVSAKSFTIKDSISFAKPTSSASNTTLVSAHKENDNESIPSPPQKRARLTRANPLQDLSPNQQRNPLNNSLISPTEKAHGELILAHYARCCALALKHDTIHCECLFCNYRYTERDCGTEVPLNPATFSTPILLYPAVKQASGCVSRYAIQMAKAGFLLKPIKRPLNLTNLSSLVNEKAHLLRNVNEFGSLVNSFIDVVAIISWVDDKVDEDGEVGWGLKRLQGFKRALRLTDQTTDKHVHLTVQVSPLDFKPEVGQVWLLRNLKHSEYDGGSLIAEWRHCREWDWCIPNPTQIVGENVEQIKRWSRGQPPIGCEEEDVEGGSDVSEEVETEGGKEEREEKISEGEDANEITTELEMDYKEVKLDQMMKEADVQCEFPRYIPMFLL